MLMYNQRSIYWVWEISVKSETISLRVEWEGMSPLKLQNRETMASFDSTLEDEKESMTFNKVSIKYQNSWTDIT